MSKEQLISLEEAFEKGIVKIGDYIDYRPTYGEYQFTADWTGVDIDDNPIFKTENFGWMLDSYNGELILVADDVTMSLKLYGLRGYNYAIEVLNKIAEVCYTSMLAYRVISINENIHKRLASCNIIKRPTYWLGTRCYGYMDYYGCTNFYVDYVSNGKVHSKELFTDFYNRPYDESHNSYDRHGVRPVVFLKSNIQMVLSEESNGTKKKPWMLLREAK